MKRMGGILVDLFGWGYLYQLQVEMETIYILLTLIIRICLFYLYVYTIMFTLQYIKKPIKSASPFSSPSLPLFSLLLFLLSPLSNTSSITLALPSTSYTAFNNNSINPQFKEPSLSFSCSNQYRFTLNQTQADMKSNSSYQIIIQGMEGLFFVNVKSLYGNIQPVQNVTQCSQSCAVQIWNNCKSQKEFDAIIVSVSGLTSIFYNVICDSDQVFSPFQYGLIILVIFSVLQVIICSKFQQADSYSNNGHYINNISLGIYCLFLIIGQTLILVQDQLTNIIVSYVCLTLSMIFGVLSIMVCFCQFFYWTKISCFRVGVSICKGKIKIRVMDGIGVCMGVGVVAAWYFTNKNWIISNVIYSMIFLAIIKLVKLGSLKMATITFIFTAVCNILFIILTQTVRKVYFNDIILYIFNNPFFIMCPCINFTPNQKCSWLFISCIAYPTILLCYLDRFDQSRSSKIYFTVYVICLITCSSLWIIISHFVPFTLPFDLLNSPICILFVGFFANRRGEFELLWNGQIFDAKHRNKSQQDHQLMDSLKQGRSDSYKSDWFKLKYSQMSSSSMQQALQNVRRSLQMQSLPIQRKENAEQKDSNPGGI